MSVHCHPHVSINAIYFCPNSQLEHQAHYRFVSSVKSYTHNKKLRIALKAEFLNNLPSRLLITQCCARSFGGLAVCGGLGSRPGSCTCTNARFAAIVPNRPALVCFAESSAATSLRQHNRFVAGMYALFRIDGLLTRGTGVCWYCCGRCNETETSCKYANHLTPPFFNFDLTRAFSWTPHADPSRPSLERRLRRAIPKAVSRCCPDGMVNVCRRISWPAVHQLDLFLCSNVASLRRQLTFTSVPSHDISLTRADRVATLEEAKGAVSGELGRLEGPLRASFRSNHPKGMGRLHAPADRGSGFVVSVGGRGNSYGSIRSMMSDATQQKSRQSTQRSRTEANPRHRGESNDPPGSKPTPHAGGARPSLVA